MKKIHERLLKEHKWYANWHENPHHLLIHSAVLLVFIFTVGTFLFSSLKTIQSAMLYDGSSPCPTSPISEIAANTMLGVDDGTSIIDPCDSTKVGGGGGGGGTVSTINYDEIASKYGMTGAELQQMLLADPALKISPDGKLFFAEPVPTDIPTEVARSESTTTAIDILSLHSKPNATAKIYLDFDGEYVTGTSWNWNGPISATPFSIDSDPNFNSTELSSIETIWKSVSEDFSPFNVDVTTERPLNPDLNHYAHLIITPSWEWYGQAGGVAFIGSFRWNPTDPAFVFSSLHNNNLKHISEAASHEVGHTMGLYHVALYDTACVKVSDYHPGTGNTTGWAPIMGVGYFKQVTQWANTNDSPLWANSYGCRSEQVDTDIITGTAPSMNGDLRWESDEAGDSSITSTGLFGTISNNIVSVNHSGVLTLNDIDVYEITTATGNLNFTVSPMDPIGGIYGNADFRARILNSSGAVLSESNPDKVAPATVSATSVPAGTYYLEIATSGYLDPSQPGGYSKAGSMGQYRIVGSYPVFTFGTQTITSVTIGGVLQVGHPLSTYIVPSGATATYKWYRANTPAPSRQYQNAISGATQSTYTPTSSDVGRYIRVEVRGTGNFIGLAISNKVGPISP